MSDEEIRVCPTCGTTMAPHDDFCPVYVPAGSRARINSITGSAV